MFILSYTLSRLLISYNIPLASQLGSLIIRLDYWIKIHLIRSILEYQIQELALILEVEMPLSHFRIPGLEFPVLASDCNILLINCWKSAIDDSNNWVTAIHVEVLNWVSSSWFWSGPSWAIAGIWAPPWGQELCLSLSLPLQINKQKKKKIKYIHIVESYFFSPCLRTHKKQENWIYENVPYTITVLK